MTGGVTASTILTALGTAATVAGAVKSFTTKSPSAAGAAALEKPSLMPTPDDEVARAAKKRAAAGLSQKRGRQSTILSDPLSGGDLLGA